MRLCTGCCAFDETSSGVYSTTLPNSMCATRRIVGANHLRSRLIVLGVAVNYGRYRKAARGQLVVTVFVKMENQA